MSGRQPLPVRTAKAERESGRVGERVHPASEDARMASGAATPEDTRFARSPAPPLPRSPDPGADDMVHLWAALHDVLDPEFPISIVDLGLVYAIRRAGPRVEVDLTFTATACPCMDFIHDDGRTRLLREPGVGEVSIRDVWDPPWTRERITAAGRATLRQHGVAA